MMSQFEFDRDQLGKLDKEDLILIILALQEQVQELQQTVAKQAAEIQELLDQLARNSRMHCPCKGGANNHQRESLGRSS